MRHRFEVIRDGMGMVYKCKRCGSTYIGNHATEIPCKAIVKLAVTDRVLKRSKELRMKFIKGENDE